MRDYVCEVEKNNNVRLCKLLEPLMHVLTNHTDNNANSGFCSAMYSQHVLSE